MAEGSGSAVAYLGIDVGKRTHGACALMGHAEKRKPLWLTKP